MSRRASTAPAPMHGGARRALRRRARRGDWRPRALPPADAPSAPSCEAGGVWHKGRYSGEPLDNRQKHLVRCCALCSSCTALGSGILRLRCSRHLLGLDPSVGIHEFALGLRLACVGLDPMHGFVSFPHLPLGLCSMRMSWRDEVLRRRTPEIATFGIGTSQSRSADAALP